MRRVYKIVPLRVTVERVAAYTKAAARDGFSKGTGAQRKVNLSGWLRSLADGRLDSLGIEVGDPILVPNPTEQQEIREAARVKKPHVPGRFGRRRVRERTALKTALPLLDPEAPPPPIAPDCWHVGVGAFCKRCGYIRRA